MQNMLRAHRRMIIWSVIAVLVLYAVIPQFGVFRRAQISFADIQWSYVVLAALWTALTYVCAAQSYRWLSFKPLIFMRTLIAQLAALFATRIVPAGIGGIGVNFAYLRSAKHSTPQAAAVVAINNTLGFIANALLLAIAVLVFGDSIPSVIFERDISLQQISVIGGALLISLIITILIFGNRLKKGVRSFITQVGLFRYRLPAVGRAFCVSLLLTAANVLALYSCAASLGANATLVVTLLVYSFAIILGTFTPTPGGLGGIEAGLVLGFMAFGMDAGTALAVTLIFRMVSNWVPLCIGALAFWYAESHRYFVIARHHK